MVAHERPDVAIVGWLVGDAEHRESLEIVTQASAFSCVLCLVGHAETELALEALAAGASGCISKDADVAEVCNTIVAAGQGEILLPREVQERLIQLMRREAYPSSPRLTVREAEVLALAVAGLTASQMAERLSISMGTVKTHLHHVYNKLAVQGRAAAVAEALRRGLAR